MSEAPEHHPDGRTGAEAEPHRDADAPVPGAVDPADPLDPLDPVVAAAAAEPRRAPITDAEAADLADRYDAMMRVASLFDDSGEEMRQRAKLGPDILRDPAFTGSVELSRPTAAEAEEAIVTATTGKRGLLARSIELDADALVLRATVLTYRWIDELQQAAFQTLGSIAGRAIGYLAPEVALGGAIVSAGLIETDALDRDGVAAYLNELAEANPELMEHVTSGGGGLLDGLQMRSVLTAGVLAGERGRLAGRGGLRAIGLDPLPTGFDAALRDVAGGLVEDVVAQTPPALGAGAAPRNLTELMGRLDRVTSSVQVQRVAEGRYIAYLAGPGAGRGRHLRLVGGDASAYGAHVVRSITTAVAGDADARVMLVGSQHGGVTAAEVAAAPRPDDAPFVIDQVVTAGSPSAHVPRIPEGTRVLSLEDRSDPVALLGSLINAGVGNRVTVVFDGAEGTGSDGDRGRQGAQGAEGVGGESLAVTGARAADAAGHPELEAELERLRRLGFLAG